MGVKGCVVFGVPRVKPLSGGNFDYIELYMLPAIIGLRSTVVVCKIPVQCRARAIYYGACHLHTAKYKNVKL